VPAASADRPLRLHCGHLAALPRTAAGQKETLAVQQMAVLFDHLVGAQHKVHGELALKLSGIVKRV
jgi:hypothetical protein